MDARRTALFLAGLLAIFLVAVGIGSAVEPADTESGGHTADESHAPVESHDEDASLHAAHQAGGAETPAGLSVSDGGYALGLSQTIFRSGEPAQLRFAIADPQGSPVTEFDQLHERRMHLILVRRDGTGFRHLHPEIDAQGAWSTPVEFAEPGAYRAYADFSVAGEQHTLAADLFVSGGEFEARPFPAPTPVAATDGYEVELDATGLRASHPASLAFSVTRDGEPVEDLAPYLGAKGHLVALREGDLAYLHVHPEGSGHSHDGQSTAGHEEIAFAATFPTAGRYRLYLQLKHDGAVHTAQFTIEVAR